MNFRRVAAIVLVLIMVLTIVSCNKKEPAKPSGSEPTAEETGESLTPTNKKLVAWLWSDDPADVEIAGFARTYPDYTIDHSVRNSGVFEDHSNDLPRLMSSLASGEQPDVYWGWSTPAEAFYTDLFAPIQEYFDKDPEMNEEDFHPAALDMLSFNDKIYFMTNEYASYMFVWNRDLFEDAGLNPDQPPKTWEEFYEYGERLTTYNPNGSLKTIGVEQDHFNVDYWYAAYTGKFNIDKTGLKFDYNNADMLKTLEFANSLSDIYGGNEKKGDGWWWFPFNNIGMTQWGGAYIEGVNSSIGKVPLPDENSERHQLNGIGPIMGIPRNANNPLAGWLALKYFMTDGILEREIANYQAQTEIYIPRYSHHKPTKVKLDEYFEPLLDEVRLNNYKLRNELIENADVPCYSSPVQLDINTYWNENIAKVYSHEMAPKDFLDNVQKHAESLIEDFIEQKKADGWVFNDDGVIPPSEQ